MGGRDAGLSGTLAGSRSLFIFHNIFRILRVLLELIGGFPYKPYFSNRHPQNTTFGNYHGGKNISKISVEAAVSDSEF
jgi:hypothetical protein